MSVRLELVKKLRFNEARIYQRHLTEISLEVALVSTYEVNNYIGAWVDETIVIFAAFKQKQCKEETIYMRGS